MRCPKQRAEKQNKQGNQKEETVKKEMPDFGAMLPGAVEPTTPLKPLSAIAGSTSSSEIVAGVLDVVERQNDKERRVFMKLQGAQIKNTILY